MHVKYMGTFSPNCRHPISPSALQQEVTHSLKGQSSPGILQVGQHPSKGTRQIPQTSPSLSSLFGSDFPVSHRHCATACQCLMVTFMRSLHWKTPTFNLREHYALFVHVYMHEHCHCHCHPSSVSPFLCFRIMLSQMQRYFPYSCKI